MKTTQREPISVVFTGCSLALYSTGLFLRSSMSCSQSMPRYQQNIMLLSSKEHNYALFNTLCKLSEASPILFYQLCLPDNSMKHFIQCDSSQINLSKRVMIVFYWAKQEYNSLCLRIVLIEKDKILYYTANVNFSGNTLAITIVMPLYSNH